jgi:hypothetical protein
MLIRLEICEFIFDLQMKSIIPWGSSDAAFNTKLKKRVKLVTRPLIRFNLET